MSDPVKNAEVEDVLSSIRRLVSEDKRPLQTPKTAPPSDRLVLTPALRVEDAAPSMPAPRTAARNNGEQRSTEDLADDYGDDPYLFDDPDDPGDQEIFVLRAQDIAQKAEAGAQAANDTDVVDPPSSDSVELSAKIAALETAIGDISDEWEPDGNSSDDYAGTEPSGMTWEDELDDLPAGRASPSDTQEIALSQRTEAIRDAIATDPLDSEDRLATFEMEATPTPPKPMVAPENAAFETTGTEPAAPADEPEEMSFDALATDPEDRQSDLVEAAKAEAVSVEQATAAVAPTEKLTIEQAIAEEPVPPEEPRDGVTSGQEHSEKHSDDFELAADDHTLDDHTLDETALREMISEIVQSELQGALGERITRNVRRLVRREIHRALTARDLD